MRQAQQPMSYKTILVMNDKRRTAALLEPAIRLAKRFRSHLIGINVYPRVPAPPFGCPSQLASLVPLPPPNVLTPRRSASLSPR